MIGFLPLIVTCPRKKQGAGKFRDDLSDDGQKKRRAHRVTARRTSRRVHKTCEFGDDS